MRHTLNINGKTVMANAGDTLVDAALMGKVLIPHDCATGQCETCRVRIAWGEVEHNGTAYGDTVLACQARVRGDTTITFEELPAPETVSCFVENITPLNHNIAEVVMRLSSPLLRRPGQYGKLALSGFPAREYSFTAQMDGTEEPDQAVFQIKKLHSGTVSSQIGKSITKGHKGRLSGPFGNAYLREQENGPLVLAASGTGFAPIWSLAKAVTLSSPNRSLKIVTGVNTPNDLYMLTAFRWLHEHGKKHIYIAAKQGARDTILDGTPDQYLPPLDEQTSVHVAGNPILVDRVKNKALSANAMCYADPFVASTNTISWQNRLQSAGTTLSGFFSR